jgi:hypothetical protein
MPLNDRKTVPINWAQKHLCPLPTVNRGKLQDIEQQPSRSCVGIITLQISFLVPNLASVNLVLSPKRQEYLYLSLQPPPIHRVFLKYTTPIKGRITCKHNESKCKRDKHYVHPCSNSNFTARWVCLPMIMTIIIIGLSIWSVSPSVRSLNRTTS